MNGHIPRVFINDLLARTDIIDLIDSRLKLKKHGKNYSACCPFHNDKNPSFNVSGEKQFYYCFGCGAKGNAIDFLINYEHLNFIESIEELATIHGLVVPYENRITKSISCSQLKGQIHRLYQILEELNVFYQKSLYQPQAQFVRQYLTIRGLNNNIIEYFSIGYSPFGWKDVLKHFGYQKDDIELLMKAGILVKNNRNCTYDRFRNRVIFPIRDKSGRVIGFGGRAINNSTPKYLNSSKTLIFHKGRQLYGLYEVKKSCSQIKHILVVEGYMDVISLAQFGINYAVSSLGTSTTIQQIQLIFRLTDNIICCYDGDEAGRKAAWNTLKIVLSYMYDGRQMKFLFLPEGEDPDTIIRKEGKGKFEKRIKNAISFSKFFFEHLLSKIDLSTCDGKAKLANLAIPLITQIPGEFLQIYMRRILGIKLGVLDEYQLDKLISRSSKKNKIFLNQQFKHTPVRVIIALLIQNPKLALKIPALDSLNNFKIPGLSLFINLVDHCMENPDITTGQLLEFYRGTNFSRTLETLATWNHMVVNEETEKVFQDFLARIYDFALEQRLDILLARDRTVRLSPEERREFWALSKALAKK